MQSRKKIKITFVEHEMNTIGHILIPDAAEKNEGHVFMEFANWNKV